MYLDTSYHSFLCPMRQNENQNNVPTTFRKTQKKNKIRIYYTYVYVCMREYTYVYKYVYEFKILFEISTISDATN